MSNENGAGGISEISPETNHDFLDAGVDLHALDEISFDGKQTVLERLGPAHFRSKGFSFMGFLQTVYDHVAQHTSQPAGSQPQVEQQETALEHLAEEATQIETPSILAPADQPAEDSPTTSSEAI